MPQLGGDPVDLLLIVLAVIGVLALLGWWGGRSRL
jgi:hypothetical protein